MSTLRNVVAWSRGRDPRWIARRGRTIATHYGFSARRAKQRVLACVSLLERYGARPMFATPGRVLDAEQRFFARLADLGVELAPHGYDHVDFRCLDTARAREEFERACAAYTRAGVWFRGFRCPYLSYDDTVAPALPAGRFAYGSNLAIRWEPAGRGPRTEDAVSRQLASFYDALPAARIVSRPRVRGPIVEIPASLPDDFELTIADGAGPTGVADVWSDVHEQVIARGELFAPLFHPEAYDHCAIAFEQLLDRARRSDGAIWVPRLADVADWWRERAAASLTVVEVDGRQRLLVGASPRVTVLVRGASGAAVRGWGDRWDELVGSSCELPGALRPVVGLEPGVPMETAAILREEGFLVEPADGRSSVRLSPSDGIDLMDEVAVLRHVEASTGPLVRVWRWPNAARSALSIAGDLDALSITDYLARFRAR